MSEQAITHYCIGNGALKCDGCGQEKNWQTLNQMPDALRKEAPTIAFLQAECLTPPQQVMK